MTRRAIGLLLAFTLPIIAGSESDGSGAAALRSRLEDRGIAFGGGIAGEVVRSNDPGATFWNLDAGVWVEADLGELVGLDHCYLFVNPTLVWGAEEDWQWKARLYQAWLTWDGNDTINALAGILDLNWHFHVMPSAAPFARLPARTTGEFSPGSIGLLDLYPLSAPSIRIEWKPVERAYVQTAAAWLEEDHELKGRPLLKETSGSDRWLLIAETGWRDEGEESTGWRHRLAGLGGWWLPAHGGSWGVYAFADVKLWREAQLDWQGLSGFGSVSAAQASSFERESRLVAGLSYAGLFPLRDEDTTAIAMIAEDLDGGGDDDRRGKRQAWELLHRVHISDAVWLQASVQWQNGIAVKSGDAWLAGFSAGWSF